jgi:PhnB protein
MSGITLNAYLFFKGDCREAMEFYKGIFGGEIYYQNFENVPGSEEMAGKVMHAFLHGGDIEIMEASPQTRKVELCLGGSDEAKMTKIFEGLSQGGKVRSALKKEFWGAIFGNLTDKFGVDWMMNIDQKK